MKQTTTPPEPLIPEPLIASSTIENCEALLISLASHRFVIVRRGAAIRIWSAEQLCRPIRALRPGEAVYYNGRPDQVRALAVY